MNYEQEFWKRVNKFGPEHHTLGHCWNWLGSVNKGYSRFPVKGKYVQGHRFAWQSVNGPIPNGLELDHLCRNTICVNPAHLEPVTAKVNQQRSPRVTNTQCSNGHPRNEANTYIWHGSRRCRPCNQAAVRRYAERRSCGHTWQRNSAERSE